MALPPVRASLRSDAPSEPTSAAVLDPAEVGVDGVVTAAPDAPGAVRSGVLRSILRGTSWNAVGQLIPAVIGIALTPYIIHGLGLARYGIYVLAVAVSAFLTSFDGGVGGASLRYFSVYAGRDDRVATTRLAVSLVSAIAAIGAVLATAEWYVAPYVAELIHMPGTLRPSAVFLLRAMSFVVVIGILRGVFGGILLARQRWALNGGAGTVSYVLYTAALIWVIHSRDGLEGIAIVIVGQQLLETILIVPSSLRYLDRGALGFAERREVGEVVRFGIRTQLSSIAAIVNMQVDALVIGAVLPVATVGIYDVGAGFAMNLRNVTLNGLWPAQMHLARTFGGGGGEDALEEMRHLQRLWVVAVTGWCAAGLGACYFGVIAWLGPRFGEAALVAVVLMVGYTLNLYTGVMTNYLGAIGRPGLETRFGLFGMGINVVLTVALVATGATGVVVATSVGQALAALYLLRVVRRALGPGVPSYLREVPVVRGLATVAVTVALELAVHPLVPQGIGGLLVCGLPAGVALAGYGVAAVGPRRLAGMVATRRRAAVVGKGS